MKVSDIKALAPLSDVYELKPGVKFLFAIDKHTCNEETIRSLTRALASEGIDGVVILTRIADNPIQVYGLE